MLPNEIDALADSMTTLDRGSYAILSKDQEPLVYLIDNCMAFEGLACTPQHIKDDLETVVPRALNRLTGIHHSDDVRPVYRVVMGPKTGHDKHDIRADISSYRDFQAPPHTPTPLPAPKDTQSTIRIYQGTGRPSKGFPLFF
jgi:hypothetical protein